MFVLTGGGGGGHYEQELRNTESEENISVA